MTYALVPKYRHAPCLGARRNLKPQRYLKALSLSHGYRLLQVEKSHRHPPCHILHTHTQARECVREGGREKERARARERAREREREREKGREGERCDILHAQTRERGTGEAPKEKKPQNVLYM